MNNVFINTSNHQKPNEFILRLVNNAKLHNAIIISGKKGIGKRCWANYITKFLLSNTKENLKLSKVITINEATSNLVDKNSHINYLEVTTAWDASKNKFKDTIGVDEVRKIKDFTNLTKDPSHYRVIILDSTDNLNKNAANALLKTIEEPSKNTIFFLLCHDYSMLLDTIKSRCIRIHMNNLTIEDMKDLVKLHNITINKEHQDTILKLANGSFEKLLWYIEEKNIAFYKILINSIKHKNIENIQGLQEYIKTTPNIDVKGIFEIIENYLLNHVDETNVNFIEEVIFEINQIKKDIPILNLDLFTCLINILVKIIKH